MTQLHVNGLGLTMVRKNTRQYVKGKKVEIFVPCLELENDYGEYIQLTPYDFTNKQLSNIIKSLESFKAYRTEHKGKKA